MAGAGNRIGEEEDRWKTKAHQDIWEGRLDPLILSQDHRNGGWLSTYAEPGTLGRFGFGVSDAVDADSEVRNDPQRMTHARARRQLLARPFLTVPYMFSGEGNPDVEGPLLAGTEGRGLRSCISTSMVPNERLEDPMPGACVLPAPFPGVRGGEATRSAMRRPLHVPTASYTKQLGCMGRA